MHSAPLVSAEAPSLAAFAHRQSAHCESGVVSALLSHCGLPLSEPMAFGLAGALAFAYIPLIKLAGMPLIAYRMPPGHIIRGVQKRIGVRMVREKFGDPARGMAALDNHLDAGQIVGLQTCVYWLPYFPDAMRFHFNAHNLIVYGRDGDDYLISDPVFEQSARCPSAALQKARFAKGALAAKGLLYYPAAVPAEIDYKKVIPQAIRANYRTMNQAPLPVIGIRGIRYLAKKILALGASKGAAQLLLYLAHIVRMQEEIGTGGAGFRFIYASFLQESARLLGSDLLGEASRALTDAGDEWRLFALQASKMSRNRKPMDVAELAQILNRCADREQAVWALLRRL
jgi:hypothetical protein